MLVTGWRGRCLSPPLYSPSHRNRARLDRAVCLGPAQHRIHVNALLLKLRAAQQHGDGGGVAKQRLVGFECDYCTQRSSPAAAANQTVLPPVPKFGLVGFQPNVLPGTVLMIDRRNNLSPHSDSQGPRGGSSHGVQRRRWWAKDARCWHGRKTPTVGWREPESGCRPTALLPCARWRPRALAVP